MSDTGDTWSCHTTRPTEPSLLLYSMRSRGHRPAGVMTRVALVALLTTNAAAFVSRPGQPIFAYLQAQPRPPVLTMMVGKGMNRVCLVELGSGCCHGNDSTKAAIRACNNAIEWNSVKVRTIIPGSYDAMVLHVHVAVPAPETVDLAAVAACFPYGNLQPIVVEDGGLLGSVRRSHRMPCPINRASHIGLLRQTQPPAPTRILVHRVEAIWP